ncbi:winged helix-turn-helix transcriptional regulator [Paenibacillus mucilaginosus]|uniref:Hth-type transcriptional regulator ykvn n=3 Tax=Paenibacillus mucilaginosus TaxID=61624 RepID=H6NNU8_9BACL|nr:winged helix-turn-helix transcriptional regulator [Paenibacillus mucilaginosus]AFC30474.1 hth-type transcriptional regulator ykvn [Paenibacillus mucilaginosus 3016]AFH62779.1 MarR family transcriptional regulator [Paenibacillus mucilaginosus K02]MCG7218143.1 winged helix-turn-helix transcriptional regulator [Paenibacillus mucilaginosus]WDM30937.1 winged helix-turn-helix transcriptional regulator [Paenibacillus mucilaginosus]WFA19107.1 HxlR family transcriptional regulator [Paenibacillus muc
MKVYYCNLEVTMEVIGGKWKGLVLYYLIKGPKRTSELKQLVHGITQKMLIQTLRELEADGLVSRKMFNQVPPRVEYSTTELGQSLEPILRALCQWGDGYADKTFAEGEFQILNNEF